MIRSLPSQQKGSTLFVALILLLVITLLAVSGTREVVLESRITANFIEQQKLLNDSEATLRQGEMQLTKGNKPVEPGCAADGGYCLRNEALSYIQTFTTALAYAFVSGDSSSNKWYAVPTPSGALQGQAENPEYGNMMLGIGTFRYEVNTQSTHTPTNNKLQLRSNVAKVFN